MKENYILLEHVSTESVDLVTFMYSPKKKGAGYHKLSDSLHTVIFELDNFKGKIKLQGTLSLYPSDTEWCDIVYNQPDNYWFDSTLDIVYDSTVAQPDSTILTNLRVENFVGNWVWIRCAYILEQGTIVRVRYNY